MDQLEEDAPRRPAPSIPPSTFHRLLIQETKWNGPEAFAVAPKSAGICLLRFSGSDTDPPYQRGAWLFFTEMIQKKDLDKTLDRVVQQ